MEVGFKGVLLFLINIIFNLYTLYLLSHVYSTRTSHIYRCKLRGQTQPQSHLSNAIPTPNSTRTIIPDPRLVEISQIRTQTTVELAPIERSVRVGNLHLEPIPRERKVEEFVVMIPSAKRSGSAFYLSHCVDALLQANVPATAIMVMKAAVEDHPQLDAYLNRLARAGQKVKRVERIYRSSDLSVENLKAFRFEVRPVEWKDVGAQVAAKDPEDRKRWRSKEAMDFVFISRKALRDHEDTTWFVFLQDDAVLRAEVHDLFHSLRSAIQSNPTIPVFHLNKLGNVAIMFHRSFLESFVAFASLRFDLMPIDWLLGKQKHALGTKDKLLNIFRHVGLTSSFAKNDRTNLVQ